MADSYYARTGLAALWERVKALFAAGLEKKLTLEAEGVAAVYDGTAAVYITLPGGSAVSAEPAARYTNLFSTGDPDYAAGSALNSSGAVVTQSSYAAYFVTGWIPVGAGNVVRCRATVNYAALNGRNCITIYDGTKTRRLGYTFNQRSSSGSVYTPALYDDKGFSYTVTNAAYSYVRIVGCGDPEQFVVTVNEEIVETSTSASPASWTVETVGGDGALTLRNRHEYRVADPAADLRLTLDSAEEDYAAVLAFRAADGGCSLTLEDAVGRRIYLDGDGCEDGRFSPVPGTIYTVAFLYNGFALMGYVTGAVL